MPALLLAIFAKVPERWRHAGFVLLALVLLVIGCGAVVIAFNHWRARDREEAVQLDRSDISRDAAERVLAADRAASANAVEADAAFQNSQEGLRDEVRTKGTDAPVGPATAGVLERLRREQAGAARHDPTR